MNSKLNLAPLITPTAGHQTGNQLIGAIPLVSRVETVGSSSLEVIMAAVYDEPQKLYCVVASCLRPLAIDCASDGWSLSGDDAINRNTLQSGGHTHTGISRFPRDLDSTPEIGV